MITSFDAKAAVRSIDTHFRCPPALAITANAIEHQVGEYLAAGFTAHLPKPVRRADLARIVAAVTGRAAA